MFLRARAAHGHAERPRAAAVEERLHLVKTELALLGVLLAVVAVRFDEDDRKVRHLRKGATPPGLCRLQEVKPLVLVTSEQPPAKFEQGGLARARFPGEFKERERFLLVPDLLHKERAEEEREDGHALPVERPEKIVQPAGVELPGRVYLEIGKRRFDARFPDFKIFILVELDLLARAVGVLIEDIRPEARDIADIRHGGDGRDARTEPAVHQILEVSRRPCERAAAGLGNDGLEKGLRVYQGLPVQLDDLFGHPGSIGDLEHVELFPRDFVVLNVEERGEDVGYFLEVAAQAENIPPVLRAQDLQLHLGIVLRFLFKGLLQILFDLGGIEPISKVQGELGQTVFPVCVDVYVVRLFVSRLAQVERAPVEPRVHELFGEAVGAVEIVPIPGVRGDAYLGLFLQLPQLLNETPGLVLFQRVPVKGNRPDDALSFVFLKDVDGDVAGRKARDRLVAFEEQGDRVKDALHDVNAVALFQRLARGHPGIPGVERAVLFLSAPKVRFLLVRLGRADEPFPISAVGGIKVKTHRWEHPARAAHLVRFLFIPAPDAPEIEPAVEPEVGVRRRPRVFLGRGVLLVELGKDIRQEVPRAFRVAAVHFTAAHDLPRFRLADEQAFLLAVGANPFTQERAFVAEAQRAVPQQGLGNHVRAYVLPHDCPASLRSVRRKSEIISSP